MKNIKAFDEFIGEGKSNKKKKVDIDDIISEIISKKGFSENATPIDLAKFIYKNWKRVTGTSRKEMKNNFFTDEVDTLMNHFGINYSNYLKAWDRVTNTTEFDE